MFRIALPVAARPRAGVHCIRVVSNVARQPRAKPTGSAAWELGESGCRSRFCRAARGTSEKRLAINVTFALTLSAWSAYEADAPDAPEQTTEVHMFSTNIKQKGRKGRRLTSRRRAGGILVGGTFGL